MNGRVDSPGELRPESLAAVLLSIRFKQLVMACAPLSHVGLDRRLLLLDQGVPLRHLLQLILSLHKLQRLHRKPLLPVRKPCASGDHGSKPMPYVSAMGTTSRSIRRSSRW